MPTAKRNRSRLYMAGRDASITGTFWSGPVALTTVGRNKAECEADARARLGEWDSVCWSTPVSIHNDLTGVTAAKTAAKGQYHNAHQDGLW